MSEHARRTYFVEAVLTVDPHTHEQLQTPDGIRAEVTSWLEGLDARVHAVTVRPADTHEQEENA